MGLRKLFALVGAVVAAVMIAAGIAQAAPNHADRVTRVGDREVLDPAARKPAPNHKPHNRRVDNVRDRGGRILPSANIYGIWWGDPNGWPADTNAGITDFLTGFGPSTYLQTIGEYMRGASLSTTFVRNFTDTSAPSAGDPGVRDIGNEVARVLTANGVQPDPNGIYMVFTSNFPSRTNYCAWHSGATVSGVTVAVAYMPNVNNVPGCGVGSVNGYSAGTQALANVTAHEVIEAITDPIPITSWADRRSAEIADKCAWKFSGTVAIGSTTWRVQENWSNAVKGCIQR